MSMRKITLISGMILMGMLIPLFLYSNEERVVRTADLVREIEETKSDEVFLEFDTNEDGSINYLVKLNEKGEKIAEALDYNHNGSMDDFYFYENGVLARRLIDSNYDAVIDIWVYLSEGVYIRKYEQDTNHDGVVDKVKLYGEED